MAGEEDPRNKQSPSSPENSRQWHDDENPFVAFRRFADEQISSMMQSVMGLPSSATSPQSGHWAIFSDDQAYRDQVRARQRQDQEYNGDGNKTDEAVPSSSRITESSAQNDKYHPARLSRSRWYDPDNRFNIDMFFNSFFDRLWLDDHTTARLFGMYHHPMFSSMTSAESPMWPLNYLMFSPYSPLHLERQARYRAHREQGVFSSLMSSMSLSSEDELDPDESRWREAFEDLLRLENGEPMLDRNTAAVARSEPRKDWLGGLIKRGSLGKHWKFSSASENQPWSSIIFDPSESGGDKTPSVPAPDKTLPAAEESNTKPATELDVYDRFLADIDAREREFFGAHQSPLLEFLLADRRSGPNRVSPPASDYNDDTESWLELVSGGNKHSVPESKSESESTDAPVQPPAAPITTESPVEKPSVENYVVSNTVRTKSVHLPDGSIQTRIVRTTRYLDGREESNTSTEVVNPPQRDQNSGQQPGQEKGGWFWRD
ncbi:hypothetical protein BDW74DRAFT_40361 [Aspergillus multicolor]|uniref:uncharacterized protein n=1 Tax=Aspergillus multicolor TaxID=41759 RepID=UPI003CCE2AB5